MENTPSRLFPPPGLRLVLTALSPTSPRRVVRNAGQVFEVFYNREPDSGRGAPCRLSSRAVALFRKDRVFASRESPQKKKRSILAAWAAHRRRNQVIETARKFCYRGLDSFKEQGLIYPNRRRAMAMMTENSLQAQPFAVADLVNRQLGKQFQYLKLPLQIIRVIALIWQAHPNFPITNREHSSRIVRAGSEYRFLVHFRGATQRAPRRPTRT